MIHIQISGPDQGGFRDHIATRLMAMLEESGKKVRLFVYRKEHTVIAGHSTNHLTRPDVIITSKEAS